MKNKGFFLTITSLLILFSLGCYHLFLITKADTGTEKNKSKLFDIYIPKPVNILLMVKDRFSSNTDTFMLVNYKPLSAQINILSIPRDTKVLIDGRYAKINSAYWRGGENGGQYAIDAVKQLIDVDIDHYVVLELDVIPKVVDALGGVEYDVPIDMEYRDRSQNLYINIKKGKQHLNGNQVEHLLRYRHPNKGKYPEGFFQHYDGGDLTRIDNQQKFFLEFFRQKAKFKYFLKVNDVLNIILQNTDTDLALNDCLKLTAKANLLSKGKLNTFRILGTDEKPYWYYVFNGQIKNNKTKAVLDADKVIKKYFRHNEIKDGS